MKQPIVFKYDSIPSKRPDPSNHSLLWRWKVAWYVLTGQADAVIWNSQKGELWQHINTQN